MRLLAFKYLSWQRILALTITVMLSSMLFSMTSISLLGFYRSFNSYLGKGEDLVVIYNRRSRTPFTGVVPAQLTEELRNVKGVLAVSEEAIAPCVINGQPFFLRGIIPEDFVKLNRPIMLEGDMIQFEDTSSVIVGRNVAERLKVRKGDVLLVHGVLTDLCVEMKVKGVYYSKSFLDDEILAPLYVGQWLRGVDYALVTLIRVRIDGNSLSQAGILEIISSKAYKPTSPSQEEEKRPKETIMPRAPIRFRVEDIGVEEAYEFMKSYMHRYGATRESILALSITVFLLSSASIATAYEIIIIQHKDEIKVLRSLGASRRLLTRDLFVKLLPWTMLASLAGVVIAFVTLKAMQQCGYLLFLCHTVPVQVDPFIIALNFVLFLLLSSISVLKGEIP